MKYLNYMVMLLASLAMFSCSDSAYDEHPVLSDAPIASELIMPDSTVYEYVFLEENADNPFETFVYTAADFGQQVVVNYELQVDTLGGDFTKGQAVQSPVQELYQAVTTNTFNLALAAIGATPEVAADFQVRVKSYLNNPEATAVYSAPITLTVTPFDASFPPIYAVGNATPAGWDPASAVVMKATTLTLYEGPLELTATTDPADVLTFRFLLQQEWGDDLQFADFDLVETVPEGLLIENVNEYGESNFEATQSGTYQFTINLDNNGQKTLKAELQ